MCSFNGSYTNPVHQNSKYLNTTVLYQIFNSNVSNINQCLPPKFNWIEYECFRPNVGVKFGSIWRDIYSFHQWIEYQFFFTKTPRHEYQCLLSIDRIESRVCCFSFHNTSNRLGLTWLQAGGLRQLLIVFVSPHYKFTFQWIPTDPILEALL